MKAFAIIAFCVLVHTPLSLGEPFDKVLDGFCRSRSGKRAKGSYDKHKFDTIQKCRDECLKLGDACTGIEYHKDKKRCEVHKKPITRAASSRSKEVTCEVRCGPLVNTTCTSPTKRPSHCDFHTYVKYGDGRCNADKILARHLVHSIINCTKHCEDNLNCFTWEFDLYRRRCTLYGEKPNVKNPVIPRAGYICYGFRC